MTATGAIALLNVIAPRYFCLDVDCIAVWSTVLGVIWLVLEAAAVVLFRWRALWLLVAVPFLLYWPVGFWLLDRACKQNINACP
jgi:hypothetical protein